MSAITPTFATSIAPASIMNITTSRQVIAETEYQAYDFGPGLVVEDHSGWEHSTPGAEWTRSVFVRAVDEHGNAEEGDTERLTFSVTFADASASTAITDVAAMTQRGTIVGKRASSKRGYRVSLREDAGDKGVLMFDCMATSLDDAESQAEAANPGSEVVNIMQFDDVAIN